MRKTLVGATLACVAALTTLAAPVAADEPAWGYPRDLTCDGEALSAHVTPGGVFTTFHVDGTNDVIIAKHLQILGYVTPGEWLTTRHVPGFARNATEQVHCSYVDSRNFEISFTGLRR